MPKSNKTPITKDKSGWLFIGFVVIVGAILILYFTVWDSGQDGGIEESEETGEVIGNETADEDESGQIRLQEEEEKEEPEPSGEGGSGDAEIYGLDFTLEGHEEAEPVIQGDTYYYDLEDGNYLTVMPRDMKGVVLESMTVTEEEQVDIKGARGVKYTGKSAKDGSTIYIVLVERGDYLFHVTGSELFLDNFNNIIEFNN